MYSIEPTRFILIPSTYPLRELLIVVNKKYVEHLVIFEQYRWMLAVTKHYYNLADEQKPVVPRTRALCRDQRGSGGVMNECLIIRATFRH